MNKGLACQAKGFELNSIIHKQTERIREWWRKGGLFFFKLGRDMIKSEFLARAPWQQLGVKLY